MSQDVQVTRILDSIFSGDAAATDDLLPIVYDELRRIATTWMALERRDHTLQATAIVHEAYMRLLGDTGSWSNRRHFFGAAAEAMRRILVDHARMKGRQRRGGDRIHVALSESAHVAAPEGAEPSVDLVLLDAAIRRMEEEDPRMAEIVKLRYFAGLSVENTARSIGVSTMTVSRTWRCARAWLRAEVEEYG